MQTRVQVYVHRKLLPTVYRHMYRCVRKKLLPTVYRLMYRCARRKLIPTVCRHMSTDGTPCGQERPKDADLVVTGYTGAKRRCDR